ncbi:MAG: ion transporter [Planctomycetia bacterium]|nr:ion transporter [Candidatus Brocadia sp.]QOJ07344.1 MAG: ion transporter [Planctomycetia bacterium]TVL98237.1 MAG: potassium channel protein [Candidatus Brocadia sp. BL1]HQU30378.1 ion transporter [Candidatus Brocadia sapporoensis]
MIQKTKNRISNILNETSEDDASAKVFNVCIITLILLNVFVAIMETVEGFLSRYQILFKMFETFSIIIFTLEYFLRLWTCTADGRFKSAVGGRVRYAVTPFALVDLMAILPFYLPMILPYDLRIIRALRLFRLLRILKMGRYSESLRTLENVLKEKKEELLIALFTVLILLVVASSLIYFVENTVQPESFSSIPATMWWGVATLTTVGYGDIYPITPLGKFFGAIVAILGVGIIAIPAGILTSGFTREIQRKHGKRDLCPHCGKDISEPPERSQNTE